MPQNYAAAAHKYATDVVTGVVPVAELTQLACQRHLDDLQKSVEDLDYPFVFNPTLERDGVEYHPADRICAFIECLRHTKGAWKGRPLVLEPWQIFCVAVPFGWIRKDNGFRRFTETYLEIPRKNGKSLLAAAIGLYMLVKDGEGGSEILTGGSSIKQAREVFAPAWLMVKADHELRDHFKINLWGKKPDGGMLTLEDYSKFEMLIGNPPDGASPSCGIVDEFHEHADSKLYDTLKTGMGARAQPMLLVTTTAGVDISSACYTKRLQVAAILRKTDGRENDFIFGVIYTLDDTDDWTLIENWRKANPNFGISVFEHYLVERLTQAVQEASSQNIIRCKHLNQWMNAGSAFFNMIEVERCVDPELRIETFAGKMCWVGVDIASKKDLAAVVAVFKENQGGNDHYYLFAWAYLPERATEGKNAEHFNTWVKEGWIETCGEARLNLDIIEEKIYELARNHEVAEIPHDPWNAAQMCSHFLTNGLQAVEIPQTVPSFSEPTKELDALILDGKIHFQDNPVMKWCLSNVVVKYDNKDNVFPRKERHEQKIDIAIAGIMALGRAMTYKVTPTGNDGSCIIY